MLGERREVIRLVAAREDAAVHARVQRLDAAVEHLRESGDVGDLRHGKAFRVERPGGAPGGEQVIAEVREAARE